MKEIEDSSAVPWIFNGRNATEIQLDCTWVGPKMEEMQWKGRPAVVLLYLGWPGKFQLDVHFRNLWCHSDKPAFA